MINRRGAIAAFKAAVFGGIGWSISGKQRLRHSSGRQTGFVAFGAELAAKPEDTLSGDLARLGARVYSEEGIPMFLACENVPAVRLSRDAASGASALNRKVAAAFHRYAEQWKRTHPVAPASDVAKIVELLADRDFANGGTEKSL